MLAEWVGASPGPARWRGIGIGKEGRRPPDEQWPPHFCHLLYQVMVTAFEQLVVPASQTL